MANIPNSCVFSKFTKNFGIPKIGNSAKKNFSWTEMKFEVAIQRNKVYVRNKEGIFVKYWFSQIDKSNGITLSDNNYKLMVEKVEEMNDHFQHEFDCYGILGCYKLSRCNTI